MPIKPSIQYPIILVTTHMFLEYYHLILTRLHFQQHNHANHTKLMFNGLENQCLQFTSA